MISYDPNDHKELIEQQTTLICALCGIDYREINSTNYLETRKLLENSLSGTNLHSAMREMNMIIVANQLFKHVGI